MSSLSAILKQKKNLEELFMGYLGRQKSKVEEISRYAFEKLLITSELQ